MESWTPSPLPHSQGRAILPTMILSWACCFLPIGLWACAPPEADRPLEAALATSEVKDGLARSARQRAYREWQVASALAEDARISGDEDAEEALRSALNLASDWAGTEPAWDTARQASHYALGSFLASHGQRAEAMLHFEAVLQVPQSDPAETMSAAYHEVLALLAWAAALAEEAGIEAAAERRAVAHAIALELVSIEPHAPRALQALALSHEALGRQAQDRGHRAAQRFHAAEVLQLRRRWVDADPTSTVALYDLAVAMDKWGAVEADHGRLDAADQAWQAALVPREQHLASGDQDRLTLWQIGLVQSHRLLADLASRRGDRTAAEHHRSKAEAVHGQTAAGAGSDRREAVMENQRANRLEGEGKLAAAWHHRQLALAAQTRVLAQDSGSLTDRHNLAAYHSQLSDLARQRGDSRASRHHVEQAFTLQRAVVDADPETALYRQNLAVLHEEMARFAALDRNLEAEQKHRLAALELYRGLAVDPTAIRHQYNLVLGLTQWSGYAQSRGHLEAARTAAEEAVVVAERLSKHFPHDHDASGALEVAYQTAGLVAERNGELEEATRWHQRSLEVSQALLAALPEDQTAQRSVLVGRVRLAYVAEQQGRRAEARQAYLAALASAESQRAGNPESASPPRDVIMMHSALAQLLAPEHLVEARRHAEAALSIAEAQVPQPPRVLPDGGVAHVETPPDPVQQRGLARVQRLVADLAAQAGAWPQAEALAAAALAAAEADSGDALGVAYGHAALGRIARGQGALARARTHRETALAAFRVLLDGEPGGSERTEAIGLAWAHLSLGQIALDGGELDEARVAFQAALTLAEAGPPTRRLEWPRVRAEALEGLSATALQGRAKKDEITLISRYLSDALLIRQAELAADPEHPDRAAELAWLEQLRGELAWTRGDRAAAHQHLATAYQSSEALAKRNPTHIDRQTAWMIAAAKLAQLRLDDRDFAGARAALKPALELVGSGEEADIRALAALRLHQVAAGLEEQEASASGQPSSRIHHAEVRRRLALLDAAQAFLGSPFRRVNPTKTR